MRQLLRAAGFEHIQKRACAIEVYPEMDDYSLWMENFQVGSQSLLPALVKMGLTTQEEFEGLYRAAYLDMLSDDFCWVSYYMNMWGTKGEG